MEPVAIGAGYEAGLMLGAILAAVSEPVVVYSLEGRVLLCSDAAARLHGRGGDELLGRPLAELMEAPAAEERLGIIKHVGRTGKAAAIIERLRGYYAKTAFRRMAGAGDWTVLASTKLGCPRPVIEKAQGEPTARMAQHDDPGEMAGLTNRELLVLRLLALGMTQEQIGKRLGRSTKTVEWHRTSIGRKLGRHTVVDLARFAVERGLLMVPEAAFVEELLDRSNGAQVHLG